MAGNKSRYTPINESKYKGDKTKIICRSSWERGVAKYCDNKPVVKHWSSEPFPILYQKPNLKSIRRKVHRYYPDFLIELSNGTVLLVEVKPKHETVKPVRRPRQRKATFARAVMTYAVNTAKWEAAERFCQKRDMKFQIWTEDTLRSMGIRIQK